MKKHIRRKIESLLDGLNDDQATRIALLLDLLCSSIRSDPQPLRSPESILTIAEMSVSERSGSDFDCLSLDRYFYDCYLADHPRGVAQSTVEAYYQPAFKLFEKFLGHEARVNDLTAVNLNSFTAWLKSQKTRTGRQRSMVTVKQRVAVLQTIWRHAANLDLLPDIKGVHRVGIQHSNVDCWTVNEIRQLFNAAEQFPYLRQRIPGRNGLKKEFYKAVIAVGWDSALRLGDVLTLRLSDLHLAADGSATFCIIMNKTKKPVRGKLSQSTMSLVAALGTASNDKRIFEGIPRRTFYDQLRAIVKFAGIQSDRGTFKYLRRSAITEAESILPGMGTRLAGHRCSYVTQTHYVDHTKVRTPELELPSLSQ